MTTAEKLMQKAKTIAIRGKVADGFWACLEDEHGDMIGERGGYVPAILNDGDKDYLSLEVDLATGKIKGWKRPAPVELYKFKQTGECKRVPRATETRRIVTSAKTADGFLATLLDADGEVLAEYSDYVLPGFHDGDDDYIRIAIEADTGEIECYDPKTGDRVGWQRPGRDFFAAFLAGDPARYEAAA